MLELNGKGWAKQLNNLIQSGKNHLLIAVRDEFSEEVLKKWNIQHATVFEVPVNASIIENKILDSLN
jgi:polysaccharide pyruvyl transferase WcaK-like protein